MCLVVEMMELLQYDFGKDHPQLYFLLRLVFVLFTEIVEIIIKDDNTSTTQMIVFSKHAGYQKALKLFVSLYSIKISKLKLLSVKP